MAPSTTALTRRDVQTASCSAGLGRGIQPCGLGLDVDLDRRPALGVDLGLLADPDRVERRLPRDLERFGVRLLDQLLLERCRGPPGLVDEADGLVFGA